MNKEKWLAIVLTIGSCPSGILRAIGFFVIAPLIYNVYSYFANSGDTDNLQYLETYIGDSRIIRIELPTNIDQLDANFITSYRDRQRHLITILLPLSMILSKKLVVSFVGCHLCQLFFRNQHDTK